MSSESFTISKKALITLIAASIVVIISLGIRQTFGLFYFDFNTDLDISISHFGFVMGLQLLLWGVFSPLFGVITDKYGGAVAIFIGFVFYLKLNVQQCSPPYSFSTGLISINAI